MELEVLKKEQNSLEFKILGERHSFPNLLRSRLLEDPEVIFAAYKLEHPFDKDSKFIVKTNGKKTPSKALAGACDEMNSELEAFQKAFKKALK